MLSQWAANDPMQAEVAGRESDCLPPRRECVSPLLEDPSPNDRHIFLLGLPEA